MLFMTQIKLAKIDKKITRLLRDSSFYAKNKNIDKYKILINDIDHSEPWIIEVENFISVALSEEKYREIFERYSLTKKDLLDFFILMTIATMPNPIFKTGNSRMSNTLVATAMYQEITKQLSYLLVSLGKNATKEEQELFGHKYASDVMIFASELKFAHELAYGPIKLEDVL